MLHNGGVSNLHSNIQSLWRLMFAMDRSVSVSVQPLLDCAQICVQALALFLTTRLAEPVLMLPMPMCGVCELRPQSCRQNITVLAAKYAEGQLVV